MISSKNFRYLDELIRSGAEVIVLDSDITLSDEEAAQYLQGIKLDGDDLTINGNGHTIDARGKARIFDCSGRNITLENLNLKNGFSNMKKAIISNNGGELNITKSTISGNHGNNSHVISNEGDRLNIANSILSYNKAVFGVLISNGDGDVKIEDSTVSHNRTVRSKGIISNWDYLRIANSVFDYNESERNGTIYNEGRLSVFDSNFSNNFSHFDGGAICNKGKLTVGDSMFHKNHTQFYGGAICTHNADLDIDNSVFDGNGARIGGAIFDYGNNDFDLKDCIFKNNKPDDIGKRGQMEDD